MDQVAPLWLPSVIYPTRETTPNINIHTLELSILYILEMRVRVYIWSGYSNNIITEQVVAAKELYSHFSNNSGSPI